MDFLTSIIITVAVSVILPVVFNLFYFLKRREEKKLKENTEGALRTRMPKFIKGFFLGFAILCFLGMIGVDIALIVGHESLTVLIVVTVCFTLFGSIGMFGFLLTAINCEIVDGDTITVIRLFKKRKEVDIGSIDSYRLMQGIAGGLTAFDENGIPIFSSEGLSINLDALAHRLDERGVRKVGVPYPTKAMQKTPIYKRYAKKKNFKIFAWTAFGCGLMFLLLPAIIFPNLHNYQFENYEVNGVISEFEGKEQFITFKLEGDENTYCINNIIYDELRTSFVRKAEVGVEVSLLVGYTDDRGRRAVSQVSISGEIFLDKDDAQRAETENYEFGRIMGWVFVGIGGALLAIFPPLLICAKKVDVYQDTI